MKRTDTIFFVVCLVVGPVFTLLYLQSNELTPTGLRLQNVMLGTCAAVAVIGAITLLRSKQHATFALLALGASVLLIWAFLWQKAFIANFVRNTYPSDIFRWTHYNLHGPIYGRVRVFDNAWILFAVLVGGFFLVKLWRDPQRLVESRALAVRLFFFQLLLIAAFAFADRYERVFQYIASYDTFGRDTTEFANAADVLRNYVARMKDLTHYGQHYPPGVLTLLETESNLGLTQTVKALVVLLCAATFFPLKGICRELRLSNESAASAMLLLLFAGGVLLQPTLTPLAALMFPATLCVLLLLRSVGGGAGRSWVVPSVAFGVVFAVYTVFSFSAYMLSVFFGLIVLFTLLFRGATVGHVAKVLATSVGAYAAFFLGLYIVTGFNIYACFREASRLHLLQSGHGFDTPVRYLLRANGSTVAYCISIGFPLITLCVASAIRSVRKGTTDTPPMARALFIAVPLALLFAGFSGMAFLETERIWLFFTPMVAVVAGAELARRIPDNPRFTLPATLTLMFLVCVAYGLFFRNYIWRPNTPDPKGPAGRGGQAAMLVPVTPPTKVPS